MVSVIMTGREKGAKRKRELSLGKKESTKKGSKGARSVEWRNNGSEKNNKKECSRREKGRANLKEKMEEGEAVNVGAPLGLIKTYKRGGGKGEALRWDLLKRAAKEGRGKKGYSLKRTANKIQKKGDFYATMIW